MSDVAISGPTSQMMTEQLGQMSSLLCTLQDQSTQVGEMYDIIFVIVKHKHLSISYYKELLLNLNVVISVLPCFVPCAGHRWVGSGKRSSRWICGKDCITGSSLPPGYQHIVVVSIEEVSAVLLACMHQCS